MSKRTLIGCGRLGWYGSERRDDRYGTVRLFNSYEEDIPISNIDSLSGNGKLIVKINKTRQSNHIGDFFRGFSPTTPKLHEEIILGEGELFFEDGAVGLKPKDGRETDWLNPKMLYRAHDQEVSLYFERD